MSTSAAAIAAVGAGRMGRGIALAYALRGRRSAIIDFKARGAEQYAALDAEVRHELRATLEQLASLGMFPADQVPQLLSCIDVLPLREAGPALAGAGIVYECVPETREAKEDALGRIGRAMSPGAILASTTSTMLASDLCALVPDPARFMNAHWLNPAYVIPLVEISAHPGTAPEALAVLKASLQSIGKVPVECACSPGFIVPRLQTLVMNEAARMVEEKVATAEQIDLATRYGLGFRFAAIGVLEFIDYGGNDILYHASRYLSQHLDERYAAPEIIDRYMHEGRNGLRSASGFLSYEGKDLDAYRRDVLERTVGMLRHFGLLQSPISNLEQGD